MLSEGKKMQWVLVILCSLFAVLVSILVAFYVHGLYKQKLYHVMSIVIAHLHEEYPQIEDDVIKDIFTKGINTTKAKSILESYGVAEDTMAILDHGVELKKATFYAVLLFSLVLCCVFIIIIWLIMRKQQEKLEEMMKYTQRTIDGDYSLSIRDNEEGHISMLKNKIYDMTMVIHEKNEILEQRAKQTEQMMADISHQLKTPLTSITILNDLLYNPLPEEKKIEFLDSMQKELSKMEWLLKNLLNLAKLDSKTIVIKRETVVIDSLLKECCENFQVLKEWMSIDITITGDKNATFVVDTKWTKEAINNLIKNAVEHKATKIDIAFESTPLYSKISVTDNGEGIDAQDIPHIFERFYKAKNSTSASMGLGLAFVRSILKNQQGDIKVSSILGKGTTFEMKFYRIYD